jgi:L-lactate dehydrogenase
MSDIERDVRRKAYEIIARKGATSHGIGSSVAQMCRCILRDSKEVLPLSVFVPELGTCLGWPAIVGRHGAEALPDLQLSSHERQQLQESAKALTEILATVNMPN